MLEKSLHKDRLHSPATSQPTYDRRPKMFPTHIYFTKRTIDLYARLQKEKTSFDF